MGASAIPIIVVTAFWFVVGAILPWFVPKGPNRGWGEIDQQIIPNTFCNTLFYLDDTEFLKQFLSWLLAAAGCCKYFKSSSYFVMSVLPPKSYLLGVNVFCLF